MPQQVKNSLKLAAEQMDRARVIMAEEICPRTELVNVHSRKAAAFFEWTGHVCIFAHDGFYLKGNGLFKLFHFLEFVVSAWVFVKTNVLFIPILLIP